MTLGQASIAAFLMLVAWHLGLSMDLPLVGWLGSGLALLAATRWVRVERPTWGLIFVLFATGALAGNQILEDWAVEDSWPRENGFGAGILIALLLYLLWLFAARGRQSSDAVIDRDNQTVLVWGLLCLLLISPAEAAVPAILGEPVPLLTLLGMVLACLALFVDRVGTLLPQRLLLLSPILLLTPLLLVGLNTGQGPVVGALGDLIPRSRDFTPTGFSPYQSLRSSAYLRPSNEAVMRIQSPALPSRYLAGNRLVTLSEELVWLPSQQSLRSYNTLDATLLESNEWRYAIENHHVAATGQATLGMDVSSLSRNNFIFVTPGTTHLIGSFTGISRNAADVWTPNFELGADRRWRLETGGGATPESRDPANLVLPAFWDEALQSHSESFAGASAQQTADNLVDYFLGRDYTLRTNFDPEQPFHDFFLNDRAAYCFWFASATTLALRANGIPSRLVGGYLVHEQIDDELYLVRERDAHSWVEWQDEAGYWHTIDPTPASIESFFGGYESSAMSVLYHRLAGQWQQLLDRLLANEFLANLIRYGGLAVLVFLFAREYRRLRGGGRGADDLARRWQKLWQRFLKITDLPSRPAWTAGTYAHNLPSGWSEDWRARVSDFLRNYQQQRFAADEQEGLEEMEQRARDLARHKSGRRSSPP